MSRRISGIVILVILAGGPQSAYGQGSNATAQVAAASWLELVDGEEYASSWQSAAAFFKNAVTVQQWREAAQAARTPLGWLTSRSVKSTTAAKTLPGAPDGDYVVLQFDTTFERKAAAVETVTVVREADGNWRVVGCFVR